MEVARWAGAVWGTEEGRTVGGGGAADTRWQQVLGGRVQRGQLCIGCSIIIVVVVLCMWLLGVEGLLVPLVEGGQVRNYGWCPFSPHHSLLEVSGTARLLPVRGTCLLMAVFLYHFEDRMAARHAAMECKCGLLRATGGRGG